MIEPTIGRVVWVYNRSGKPDAQPEPALICKVYNNREINVGGFNEDGMPFAKHFVKLRQPEDPIPAGMYASWMPFQVATAAKAAEAPAA
jgi:hypothetical protein